MQNEPNLIFK